MKAVWLLQNQARGTDAFKKIKELWSRSRAPSVGTLEQYKVFNRRDYPGLPFAKNSDDLKYVRYNLILYYAMVFNLNTIVLRCECDSFLLRKKIWRM